MKLITLLIIALTTPFLFAGIPDPTLANSDDIEAAKDRANHTGTQDWNTLTATPTTLNGYGLTMSTNRLLGRSTGGTGSIQEITLGTNLTFSGTTLNATGGSTNLTAGPVRSTGATSSIVGADVPDNTFAIAKTIGLQPTLDRKAGITGGSVGFYDDFSRYSEGYVIGDNITTPLVGPVYRQNWTTTSMLTEVGGLRCVVDGNSYLGSSVPTPDGILDATFEIETASPAGAYEINQTGFTFAFKETSIVAGNSSGNGLAIAGGIHINVGESGVTDCSHFQSDGSGGNFTIPFVGKGPLTFDKFPVASGFGGGRGVRYRINIRVEGNRIDITHNGRTLSFEHANRVGDRVGETLTYFYFQLNNTVFSGLPAPAVRNYPKLMRMWINAPDLSLNAATSGYENSRFAQNKATVYPNKVRISVGDRPLIGHNLTNGATIAPLEVTGAGLTGTSKISGTAIYAEGRVSQAVNTGLGALTMLVTPMAAHALGAPLASVANSTDTTARIVLPNYELETGSVTELRYAGTYGSATTYRNQIVYGVPVNGDTVTVAGVTLTKSGALGAAAFSTIGELEGLIEAITGIDSTDDGTAINLTGTNITITLGGGNAGTMDVKSAKTILIRVNYGGWATYFTTGAVPQNGGMWTLDIDVIQYVGANRTMVFRFWSPTTGQIVRTAAFDRAYSIYSPLQLTVAASHAGDVTVISQKMIVYQGG